MGCKAKKRRRSCQPTLRLGNEHPEMAESLTFTLVAAYWKKGKSPLDHAGRSWTS
jgi:hypothetical protein